MPNNFFRLAYAAVPALLKNGVCTKIFFKKSTTSVFVGFWDARANFFPKNQSQRGLKYEFFGLPEQRTSYQVFFNYAI